MTEQQNTPTHHRGYTLADGLIDLHGLTVTVEEYERVRQAVLSEGQHDALWEAEILPHLDPSAGSIVRVVMTTTDGAQYGVNLGPLPEAGWEAITEALVTATLA